MLPGAPPGLEPSQGNLLHFIEEPVLCAIVTGICHAQ
jgi:hypothetical protein